MSAALARGSDSNNQVKMNKLQDSLNLYTGYKYRVTVTEKSSTTLLATFAETGNQYEIIIDTGAVKEGDRYTIIYDANGGNGAPEKQTRYIGENVVISSTEPTRGEYIFLGWSTSSVATTAMYRAGDIYSQNESITLYAVWEAPEITYNIKYVSSTGANLGSSTATYRFDTTNVITCPDKTGYTKPGNQTIAWDSVSTKTITFTYTPIEYTITYNLGDGSISGQKTKYTIETETFTLPTPTRSSYNFTGWTGSNGTTKNKTVTIAKGTTGNKSYTANWEIKAVYLFDGSYVSGGITNMEKTSSNIEGSLGLYEYKANNCMRFTSGWRSGQSLGYIHAKSNQITTGKKYKKLCYSLKTTQDKETTQDKKCTISFGGKTKSFELSTTEQKHTGSIDISSLNAGKYYFEVDFDCGIYSPGEKPWDPGYSNATLEIYYLYLQE